MGKRKKPQNVVKVDLGEMFRKGEAIIPVVVQHSSKDGRRLEQTVHNVATPQDQQPGPSFNPSPAYDAAESWASPDVGDPILESDPTDRVRPRFSLRYVF